MTKNISDTIVRLCQKHGIKYTSKNPDYVAFCNDAKTLGDIFLQLKVIAGQLQEICERHDLNGLDRLLLDDIKTIEKVEHDLMKMAKKIQKEDT